MNKVTKIVSILMIAIMLCTISTQVFAEDEKEDKKVDAKNILDIIENKVKDENVEINGVQTMAAKVIKLIRNVAVIAAVILISVLGIKYMVGSAEEKAGYQKSFIPLIVGAIVVVAATQIATMIFSIMD